MFIIYAILGALLTGVILCTFFGFRSKETASRLGYWTGTVLSGLPLFLFALLIITFGSSRPGAESIIAAAIFALIEVFLLLLIFRLLRKRCVWISYVCVLLCFCCSVGWLYHNWNYADNLPTVAEPDNLLRQYKPDNEDNKLAELDEASTLSITDNFPVLDGATALYPVYAAFANAVYPSSAFEWPEGYDPWMDFDDDTPLSVLECSTTSGAYQRLVDGEADVIFVAGPSDAQLRYAEENGEEMVFTPIGRECFVFFVNAENPIENLTTAQIRDIYSGNITHWKELGVSMGRIRPFQREEGSGSQSALVRFMGDSPLMTAPTENIVDGMGGIIEKVADYRNFREAIGYSFRFYSTDMVRNGEIKLLSVNGIAPTKENILNDAYPICDSFYAVTLASNDNPNVDPLIDWISSGQGQTLIDRTGYVALH